VRDLRRLLALFVEPAAAPAVRSARDSRLGVVVTGLSAGCGVRTVAAGLRRELPAAHVGTGDANGAGDVVVVVAGRRALPVLAGLVVDRLRARHAAVVLVANRPEDPAEWAGTGALCLPQSRLGVLLLARGRRARGPFGTALRGVAQAVRAAASGP
jgi:hypothetical protein